jgi:type IV pilus assembly protein PilA
MLFRKSKSRGFTLLEILLVVGIISILAGIVIVAINPSRQLAGVRNTERKSDIKQIDNALKQYYIDHGRFPTSTTANLLEVCDTGSVSYADNVVNCGESLANLSILVPTYVTAIPKDAKASTVNGAGYEVSIPVSRTGKPVVVAPDTELLTYAIAIGTTTVLAGEAASTSVSVSVKAEFATGLLAYYPLDGDFTDSSGNGIDGSGGGTSFVTGILSSGLQTGGGYGDLTNGSSFNFALTDNWSFSVWSKRPSAGTGGNYPGITKIDTDLNGHGYDIEFRSDGSIVTFLRDGGSNYILGISGTIPDDGNYHHIAWTWNGGTETMKVYVDGTQQTNDIYTAGTVSGAFQNNTSLRLGADGNGNLLSNYFDEFAIWSTVLTQQQVTSLYNSGSGTSLLE